MFQVRKAQVFPVHEETIQLLNKPLMSKLHSRFILVLYKHTSNYRKHKIDYQKITTLKSMSTSVYALRTYLFVLKRTKIFHNSTVFPTTQYFLLKL